MTVRELAKLCDVSPSTVSKAFSGAKDVGEKTRQKIFKTAKENDCYTQFSKDKFGKKVYGIICPETSSGYYSGYITELQKHISESGALAVISADDFDNKKQKELIDYYLSYIKVDGLFIVHLRQPISNREDTPVVALLTSFETTYDAINVDVYAPLKDAVLQLKKLGHEKIAFIGERLTMGRKKVFCAAAKLSYDDPLVFTSEERFQKAGEDGVQYFLKNNIKCTAFVCAYDEIAFGAIRELQKHGFSVPDDFSVIGADNTILSEYAQTPLSTMGVDIKKICALAWERMLKKQENRYYRNKDRVTFKSELILRETVAPPKEKSTLD
ncbi:MAG: LacI family DNA-binding transcriptional regulator [Clostridia bacterium]|nr:LacI family DNA-binding transcriptional regulator [Clostridia bacterium]